MIDHNVTILCSGFGLGFYIPGLLIREKMRLLGIGAEVEVFECLFSPNKRETVERNREAYRQSFRMALAAQKVPSDTRDCLDADNVEALLARWHADNRRYFICLSGHWVHVLNLYRKRHPDRRVIAELLHLDADLTPSWKWLRKLDPNYATGYNEVRLYDRERLRPQYSIDMNAGPPIPYGSRTRKLIVHGGGWGLGTFSRYIHHLSASQYNLDIVCYACSELGSGHPGQRHFMDDPGWRPWHRDPSGKHDFPPFGEVSPGGSVSYTSPTGCNGLHRIIRNALGIVSKPGAGTLIDSLGSATPIVLLEPFGPHEEHNARVWVASGFGVPYQDWAVAGFPISMLEKLHLNLISRRTEVRDYAEDYANRVLPS